MLPTLTGKETLKDLVDQAAVIANLKLGKCRKSKFSFSTELKARSFSSHASACLLLEWQTTRTFLLSTFSMTSIRDPNVAEKAIHVKPQSIWSPVARRSGQLCGY